MEHEEVQWLTFARTDLGVARHLNENQMSLLLKNIMLRRL